MEDSTNSLVEDAVPAGRDSNFEMGPNLPAELSDRPGTVHRSSLHSFTQGHEQECESQDTTTFIGSSRRILEPGSQTETVGTHERTGQRHFSQTPAVEGFPKSASSPPSASSGHLPELVDSLKPDVLKDYNAEKDAFLENQRKSDIKEESFDEEHVNNTNVFPTDLQPDHKDAVILYHEEDKSDAEIFMNCLRRQARLNSLYEPVIALYDDILPGLGMTPVRILELAVSNSTFVFLYLTEAFCKDFWSQYSSEACLMNSIDDNKKRWSVVPVFTVPKKTVSYIPFTLSGFKGIEFVSEDTFNPYKVLSMLESRSRLRLQKQNLRKQERRRWIEEERENLDADRRYQKKKQHENKPDKIQRALHPTSTGTDPPAQLPSSLICGKSKDVDDDQTFPPTPGDPDLMVGEIENIAAMSGSTPPTEITDHPRHPSDSVSCDGKKEPGGPATVQKNAEEVAGDDICVPSQTQSSAETTNRSSGSTVSDTLLTEEKSLKPPEDVSKTKDDVDGTNATCQSQSLTETTNCSSEPSTSAALLLDKTSLQNPEDVSKTKDDVDGTNATSQSQSSTGTTYHLIEPPTSATFLTDEKSQQNPEDVSKTKNEVGGTNATSQSQSSTETTNCSLEPSISAALLLDEKSLQNPEDVSKTKNNVDGTNATSQSQSSTETTNRLTEPPTSATFLTDEKSQQNPEDVSKTNAISQSLSSTETTYRSSKPSASARRLPDEKTPQNPEDISKTKDDVVTIDPSPQRSSSQMCVESKNEGVHLAVQMTAGLCPKEGKGDNANAQSWSSPPINPPLLRLRHLGQPHFASTREEIHRHTEAVSRETFQQAYQQHTSVHPETARSVASAQPSQHDQPLYPDLPQSEQLGLRFPLSEYHGQPGHGAHSQQNFHQRGDSHPLQSPAEAVHSNDGLPRGEESARHEEKYIPLRPPSEQPVVHVHYHNVNIGKAGAVNISNLTDVAEKRTSFTRNRDDSSGMDQDQASSEDSDTNCKLLHDGPASADIPTDDLNLPPAEFLLQPNSEQEAGSPDKDLREERLIKTDGINQERKKTSKGKQRRFCCFKL